MDPEALAAIPFFAELSAEARTRLAAHAQRVAVAPGAILTLEGESGYEFFVIESGTAAVVEGKRHLRELRPGDFFGEIALLRDSTRTASVVARTPMRLVVITHRAFSQLLGEAPAVAEQVHRGLRERLSASSHPGD